MENIDKIIVLTIVFFSAFITWKVIKDFYITKFNKIFAHLIAIVTASFMLLSIMFLFIPKNYQRGQTAEVDLNFNSLAISFAMIAIIYILFKYIPSKNK
ncbi:hypothetical protein [Arcobacter sp. CECT 8985]|uniref:hypothetical protein n=1 Tax=Arcobacter sp. CECT 8985 TaxID=1935424 RepID=UPI00100A70DB|nr:hypothetical protein [Arcobacter sp. CECT 8985]RXJ87985.1 hypothetical protein CRU93_02275 [Arcobacter sp. CECT 8985]